MKRSLMLGGALVFGLTGSVLAVPVSLVTVGAAVTENFNLLASTGTSSTLPAGWEMAESGSNANTLYTAGTGSSNAGDTYSFGTSAADRALGQLRSGNLVPVIGATFTNNTGTTITSLGISYTGEQWRLGTSGRTTAPTVDKMDFQLSPTATSVTGAGFVDQDALDFTAPITVGTVGLLDGNLSANRVAISSTITGLSIPNGATFAIRWNDVDASGADDGLAIDDFSLTPNGTPPPPPPPPATGPLFINEVDYDQVGTDNAEFIELAGVAGTYSNVQLQLINGSGGGAAVYDTINLPTFTLANESNGYGFFVVSANAATVPNTDLDDSPDTDFIQNGSPDAIALFIDGTLVHYFSYEGTAGLLGGVAPNDVISSPSDDNTTAGFSLQKIGSGANFGDFALSFIAITPGAVNTGQTFAAAVVVPEPASMMLLGLAGGALLKRRRRA